MQAPSNSFIAYATAPGQTASDGTGNNGLYTEILIQEMLIPNKTISQIFQSTRARVQNKSETELNKKQTPWESTSIIQDFYFLIDDTEIEPEPNPNPDDLQNQFTDKRDGKIYKTVKIGNQIWMAENLAYKANSGCWAYNNDQDNVAKYGYLYDYETATNVCPNGWHLPSDGEWEQLAEYINSVDETVSKYKDTWKNMGNILKAKSGWHSNGNGIDKFGFSALTGGNSYHDGSFSNIGNEGRWWSSTSINNTMAWYRNLYSNGNYLST